MSAVLHINWSGGIGGAERALYQLVKSQLAHSQYRPAVAFAQAGGHYYQRIVALGVPVIDLNLRSDKQIHKIPAIRRQLAPYTLHHFHSAELTIMAASLRCRGSRRVFTQRGGTMDYGWSKRLRHWLARPMLHRGFHGFSGNTAHGARSGAALFHMPASDWQVTYNGLDFDSLEPQRDPAELRQTLAIDTAKPVIGSAANLRAWKRLERLLQACADLPTRDYWLLILGDGPEKERLITEANRLGLSDRVRFPGMVTHVGDYLQLMDIFVLPSSNLESFGNALVEGMAMGMPGIAFRDGGGLPEHIIDGQTGYILDQPETLRDKLHHLVNNPNLRQRMGAAARTSIRDKYTFRNSVMAYDQLYDEATVDAPRSLSHSASD